MHTILLAPQKNNGKFDILLFALQLLRTINYQPYIRMCICMCVQIYVNIYLSMYAVAMRILNT